jgi:hypothetical protein
VVRHEDVSEEIELVALAELFEFVLDDDACGVAVEIVVAAVTAEGDEVIGATGLVSLQIARHEVMVSGGESWREREFGRGGAGIVSFGQSVGFGGGAGTLFPTRPPSAAYGWGTRTVVVGPPATVSFGQRVGFGGGAGTIFPTRPPSAAYGWGTRRVVVGPPALFRLFAD